MLLVSFDTSAGPGAQYQDKKDAIGADPTWLSHSHVLPTLPFRLALSCRPDMTLAQTACQDWSRTSLVSRGQLGTALLHMPLSDSGTQIHEFP